jgi:hypothetical protein
VTSVVRRTEYALHTNTSHSISLRLSKPRFTMLRLLGSVTIVAVGFWLSTLLESPSERFVIIVASVGSAIGTICRGPLGSLLGASVTWLLMGAVLIVAAVISLGYLFLFG